MVVSTPTLRAQHPIQADILELKGSARAWAATQSIDLHLLCMQPIPWLFTHCTLHPLGFGQPIQKHPAILAAQAPISCMTSLQSLPARHRDFMGVSIHNLYLFIEHTYLPIVGGPGKIPFGNQCICPEGHSEAGKGFAKPHPK